MPCVPKPSRYPFDVLSDSVDFNGFLLNPHWSWQDRLGNRAKIPSTSLCHEFSKHDRGRPWYTANFPDCTDQAGLEDVDTPDGINWASAGLAKFSMETTVSAPHSGLAAFSVARAASRARQLVSVTVEGHAGPVTHEERKDDDYDFSLTSCDESLVGQSVCDQQGSLYTNDYQTPIVNICTVNLIRRDHRSLTIDDGERLVWL